jgi:hypothetical protein
MSIISINNTNVNIADVFSLVGEDRATLESDLSAPISPPIGESTSAIFVSDDTFMGGINAINSSSNLSEGRPYFDIPTSLDNSKQVGIYTNPYINSYSGAYTNSYTNSYNVHNFTNSKLTCNNKIKSFPIRDESSDWLQKHEELREQRIKIADVLYKARRLKEANAIRHCGENFVAYVADCCGDNFAQPASCGHRLCPVCMRRRSAKLSSRLEKIISGAFFKWKEKTGKKVVEKIEFIKMKNPKHIVLTLENVPKLNRFYFKRIRRYFEKLRHRNIFDKCIGGFYSVETTYNDKEKNWHVHLHVIADIPYIPQRELSATWKDITGSYIVHIKQIGSSGQSAMEASKEIAKYVVKPGEFMGDPDLINEYLDAVKGLRLVSTFGYYYGKELIEDDENKPDCECGKNQWRKLEGFYSIDFVFKDTACFYRLRNFISDS